MEAELVKVLGFSASGAGQKLWKVSPPVRYQRPEGELSSPDFKYVEAETEYVITSAVIVSFSGPETYIFAADAEGDVLGWGELPGSYRGGLDHDQAIQGLNHHDVWD